MDKVSAERSEASAAHVWRVVGPFVVPLLGALSGGVSSYMAIRIDIAELRAEVKTLNRIGDRHEIQIDRIIERDLQRDSVK